MGRTSAAVTAVIVLAMIVSRFDAAFAAPPAFGLRAGDVIVYDVTIDVQGRTIPPLGQPPSAFAPVGAITGTETMTGVSADADGTVHARLDVALRFQMNGKSNALRQSTPFTIAPDGTVRAQGANSQVVNSLNQAVKGIGQRTLHVGDVFQRTMPAMEPFGSSLSVTSKVVAEKQYHGFPTFAIQSTGGAKFDTRNSGEDVTGSIDLAGTTYYDQADAVLVGMAERVDVNALSGGGGNTLNIVTTVDLVLQSRTHTTPSSSPAPPTAAPSAAPQASPTPAPTPTPADEYYTPTPAAPTPSPVIMPYPPPSPGAPGMT